VGKYPNTEESSLALYKIGMISEEKLQDFAAALNTYRGLTWGTLAANARQRIQIMTETSLTARTERTFRTDETPRIRVNSRNIKTLTVRLYRIDLEAYFRKMHITGGVHSLDVSLIEADRTWEVAVENYRDYMPFEQSIDIAFNNNDPGAYVVSVTDEQNWRATTLVLRSDLEIIVKSSRRAEFRTGSSCGFEYAGHTEAVVQAVINERDRREREKIESERLAVMRHSQLAAQMDFDDGSLHDLSAMPAPAQAGILRPGLNKMVADHDAADLMPPSRREQERANARIVAAPGEAGAQAQPEPQALRCQACLGVALTPP